MLISTKGRYGARAMLALAANYKYGPMRASEIAEQEGISKRYLENLLASLKSAGLINSGRGIRGGYTLSKPPDQITLLDVLMPLEDLGGIVHCPGSFEKCERYLQCPTRKVWEELMEATERILREKTLSSLLSTQYQT